MHTPCSCGLAMPFKDCCGKYIYGIAAAATAEQLMRSRYSAYVHNAPVYLMATHHPDFIRDLNEDLIADTAKNTQWLRLEIIMSQGDEESETGIVEFKAWFQDGEEEACLHERSNFIVEDQQWFYTQGELNPAPLKQGRNDLCLCGSGQKHKKCCG
ncbi:YchJ family protein [Moritella sp. Urea-trap-13]|uniref:YchJ family protein n=1 Tax=Moritella sp. Urea-trap-13 TaxID=2058327 RepID=UPI000C33E756|nr:YchJ family protein [Moritella sp. Urea-trap-13]PKH09591.1 hypothetical protein CXF93_01760 [Moritella sp. Urea-trap-13]